MEHQYRRLRGEGSIYTRPRSPFLWIKYYRAGKPIRESTRTGDLGKASRLLHQRLAEVAPDLAESLKIEQLVDDLFRDYRINEHRSLDDVKTRWRLHLRPFFGSVLATELDSRLLARYIDGRREEHASNATINRELACLKRMYRLAYRSNPPRVPSVPYFPHLKETNVRQGFVTPEQFAKLVAHCPDLWLRAMLETAYNYGWRVSELLNLRVCQVNLVARTIRLEPGTTKNHEGREVTIESGRLLELFCQCVEGKRAEDHVFTRGDKPIRDFRKRWQTLCTAAAVPGLLFHDFRRTAARNLRAAGVPEEIIMRIAGWKTSSIFKRYAIVDKADVRAALQQLERARQKPLDPTDVRSSTEPEYPPVSQLPIAAD
ncbi:MAG: tyrosine-type recombinase/integrase [Acidobacteriia bacterium]|nr:tyrosine-type recombinase/integrase [Terriglobia bacterium]